VAVSVYVRYDQCLEDVVIACFIRQHVFRIKVCSLRGAVQQVLLCSVKKRPVSV
jgi:hypothetical protein